MTCKKCNEVKSILNKIHNRMKTRDDYEAEFLDLFRLFKIDIDTEW